MAWLCYTILDYCWFSLEINSIFLSFFIEAYVRCRTHQREMADTSLFHSGLIRILVEFELIRRGDSWNVFLNRNVFNEVISSPKDSSVFTRPPSGENFTIENDIEPIFN